MIFKENNNKLAFFAGLSAFIAVIENFIPLPIPIFRLGLSNIIVTLCFTIFSFKEILYISLFKTIVSHIFRGTIFSIPFLIALAGTLFFIFFCYPFYKLLKNYISFISLSITGAFFHNLGQIIISFFFIPSKAIIFFSIILIIIGFIFGLINGIFCNIIYNKIFKRVFL